MLPSDANKIAEHIVATTTPDDLSRAVAAALLQASGTMPWQRPELAGWAIVGMNHYHVRGERRLFVAMTLNGGTRCIQAEGPLESTVWSSLAKKAADAVARNAA